MQKQAELKNLINKLNNDYNPRSLKKTKEKKSVLESAKKLFDARDEIVNLFEKGTFPYKGNKFKTKEKEELDENKFFEYIENESKDISYELFEKHFNFIVPTVLAKKLYETKDKKDNNDLVKLIKVRWSNLKDEIKKISKEEIEIEKPDKILKIVEEILNLKKKSKKIRRRIKNINTKPNA